LENGKLRVAAIVPAYNEEQRITAVLEAIERADLVDEIVVVSDGSTDRTYEVAAANPRVRALRLEVNGGKAGAMCAGAAATKADILLFLDADLMRLKPEHVNALIIPVLNGDADMSVGVFRGGRGMTDLAQILVPYISGQRALRRDVFVAIPELNYLRSGVEMAITKYFNVRGLTVKSVVLSGVTHPMKEEKIGPIHGFAARMRMYYDISRVMTNGKAIVAAARQAREAMRAAKK
jgi:polyisoprenyl-phosphate glycosyltransferase